MKGLELSEQYFQKVGLPVYRNAFGVDVENLAFGLAGEGSECMGFDDELSRDHDYGPGFLIWFRDQDWDNRVDCLTEVYRNLSQSFEGYGPRNTTEQGGGRVGPMRISDFYRRYTGCPAGPENTRQWIAVPESFLAKATNGRVFRDPCGEFTQIRERLLEFYPEEVRWKKLAARAVTMAQSGQYNFPRSMKRGDVGAAFLAVREFVQAALSMGHLLEKRYMPYYKWSWRSFQELKMAAAMKNDLQMLMTAPCDTANAERIERICEQVKDVWLQQELVCTNDNYLEPLAWELYRRISDEELRRRHIMEG